MLETVTVCPSSLRKLHEEDPKSPAPLERRVESLTDDAISADR